MLLENYAIPLHLPCCCKAPPAALVCRMCIHLQKLYACFFQVTLNYGWFKWPFQGLSHLHLGDQKVTWKKLVQTCEQAEKDRKGERTHIRLGGGNLDIFCLYLTPSYLGKMNPSHFHYSTIFQMFETQPPTRWQMTLRKVCMLCFLLTTRTSWWSLDVMIRKTPILKWIMKLQNSSICNLYVYIYIYGGFLKWWYPTTMDFPTKNDHFGVFWGYHHFWKHPYIYIIYYIYIYQIRDDAISPCCFLRGSCSQHWCSPDRLPLLRKKIRRFGHRWCVWQGATDGKSPAIVFFFFFGFIKAKVKFL